MCFLCLVKYVYLFVSVKCMCLCLLNAFFVSNKMRVFVRWGVFVSVKCVRWGVFVSIKCVCV